MEVLQMKKYIAGFLTCLILMLVLSFSGFADDILNVALNSYPIFFNGQQVPVEGYNINGFTYLKLADLDKLHNTTTSFNQTEQRIEVNSNEKSLSMPTTQNLVPVIQFDIDTEKPIGAEFTEYKGCRVLNYNDKLYVDGSDLYKTFRITSVIADANTRIFKLDDKKVVVNNDNPDTTIKYKTYLYDITLFEELIGE